ncbi:hypothetical protein V9T40_008014 [Parthenolecanium corni]|uniref:Craniofacial development protein 1 n=1 Tax=Parthenolecanium corni TaxID=536013 RepID=A0AAN9TTC3_9HEMI
MSARRRRRHHRIGHWLHMCWRVESGGCAENVELGMRLLIIFSRSSFRSHLTNAFDARASNPSHAYSRTYYRKWPRRDILPDDDKNNTSSDSEDDEDYVPSSKEFEGEREASEEESADDSQDGGEGEGEGEGEGCARPAKRKRASSRRKKRAKSTGQPSGDERKIDSVPIPVPVPVPANVDDLWNAFKKDVATLEPKASKAANAAQRVAAEATEKSASPPKAAAVVDEGEPKTKTVTQIFEFAGEAVEVRKEVPIDAPAPPAKPRAQNSRGGPAGLSSVLGQIGKKNKLSVLEKSKLDWDTFKRAEGIHEDLQTHNRGKEGYLEKQDFLQRTDLRQFELEKAMRTSSRRSK